MTMTTQVETVNNASSDKFANLKNVILLDTGSSLKATFMNADLVSDITVSKNPVGMKTNAGSKLITLQAQVKGFGTTWYDPTQMANIFGFAGMVDKHRITYDSAKEDAFLVHKEDEIVKFARTPEGLYA